MNISLDFIKSFSDTLKKYKSLLPSVGILLAAILVFIPTLLLGNKIKERMKQSAGRASSIKSLMNNPPSKEETRQINNYLNQLKKDRDLIKAMAEQGSCRELLRYNLFPKPGDSSAQVYKQFGSEYRRKIEELMQSMNALDAPSDAEIRARTGGGHAGRMGGFGQPSARPADDSRVEALCRARAKETSVYANPSDFRWYGVWEEYDYSGQDQAIQDCWDSQVAYWIFEDVIETIKKMNGQSGSVQALPVKRLLGVQFNGPVTTGGSSPRGRFGARTSFAQRDIPNYVTERLPSNFISSSPTGRKGNEDSDVVHFAVSVLLEKASVRPFLKELCTEKPHTYRVDYKANGAERQAVHNQISVLQANFKTIDKISSDHELYRYGDASVVRADLVCEYLFNRSGYDSIKPGPVKKRLGQTEEASTGTPDSGGFDDGLMFP